MTSRMLQRRLVGVAAVLVALLAVGIAFKIADWEEEYSTVKELAPLAIAILAAYLASRFQARAAFHSALREVWSLLIEAKTELIAYTRREEPDPEQYEHAYKLLSRAIDEVRGVYRNVGHETKGSRGLYPLEPLHDMRKAFEEFTPGLPSACSWDCQRAYTADSIDRAWGSLRDVFLEEFEAPKPTVPVIIQGHSPRPRHPLRRGARPR